jgi:hypothetical protein
MESPRTSWHPRSIPFTILFGQQTGRLASDEDKTDWAIRCNTRRWGFLTTESPRA